jgi:large subunit ribosomal protein L24e
MAICTYCGKSFTASGKMYVEKTGKIIYFCSSKCEKNKIKLGRQSRDLKWITKEKD